MKQLGLGQLLLVKVEAGAQDYVGQAHPQDAHQEDHLPWQPEIKRKTNYYGYLIKQKISPIFLIISRHCLFKEQYIFIIRRISLAHT